MVKLLKKNISYIYKIEMPYRRTRRTRRITRKPYTRRSRKGTVAKIARSIVRREFKKNAETKCFMSNVVENTTLNTYSGPLFTADMTPIQQGTGSQNRIGNKVRFIGFHAKGFVINTGNRPVWLRALLVSTREPADITTSTELFSGQGGTPTSISTTNVQYCMAFQYQDINKAKFNVLWQKHYKLSAATDTSKAPIRFNMFKKVSLPVWWEGATQGADNQSRRVHLLLIASDANNDAEVIGNDVTLELSMRYHSYFIDC